MVPNEPAPPRRSAPSGSAMARFAEVARSIGFVRAVLAAPLWAVRPLYGVHLFGHGPAAPYPPLAERPEREIRRFGPGDLALVRAVQPGLGREELERRLGEGQEGRVVLERGEPVYLRWDAFADHELPYLRATFRLEPGDHHPSGAYTRPDRRGSGLHGELLAWSLHEARRRGCRRSIGFVPAWNRPALAAVRKPGWRGPVGWIGYWNRPGGPRHLARGAVQLEPGPSFRLVGS